MRRWSVVVCSMLFLSLPRLSLAQEELPTLADALAADPSFTILQRLLEAADPSILALLENEDNQLTLFAPRNSAFADYFADTMPLEEYFESYPERVDDLLRFHIVPAAINGSNVGTAFCSLLGTMQVNSPIFVMIDNDSPSFNGYVPLAEPVSASNGFLQPIDTVLARLRVQARSGDHSPEGSEPLPPSEEELYLAELEQEALALQAASPYSLHDVLAEDGRFTVLLAILETFDDAHLLGAGGSYMLFAPTDEVFADYFEAEDLTLDMFLQTQADEFLHYNAVPGYFTPDYLHYYTDNNGMATLCTLLQPEVEYSDGIHADIEGLTIDSADGTTLIINGSEATGETLAARNVLIYVVNSVRLAAFRG